MGTTDTGDCLLVSTDPVVQLRTELDSRLLAARESLDAARRILLPLRHSLRVVDERARSVRAKWRNAEQARRVSMQAAVASGRGSSKSTRLMMNSAQERIDEVRNELGLVIDGAGPLCDELDRAWASYMKARDEEHDILDQLVELQSAQRHATITDALAKEEPSVERARIAATRQMEREERDSELAWSDRGHFDPHYDEQELLLRRLRPWV